MLKLVVLLLLVVTLAVGFVFYTQERRARAKLERLLAPAIVVMA